MFLPKQLPLPGWVFSSSTWIVVGAAAVAVLVAFLGVRAALPGIRRSVRGAYRGRLMPWYLRWALPPELPMLLIVGRRGSGKTATATEIALARMRQGEKVYANYDIQDPRTGQLAGRVYALWQCIDLEDCTVVIDEAGRWCNSREWQKVPAQVLEAWTQSRKSRVSFIFTSVHENRVDLVVRELVDYILVCEHGFGPAWLPTVSVYTTFLEEINEVRRGAALEPPRSVWLSDDVLRAYDTAHRVREDALAGTAEYMAALAAGKDPTALQLGVPSRREPQLEALVLGEGLGGVIEGGE